MYNVTYDGDLKIGGESDTDSQLCLLVSLLLGWADLNCKTGRCIADFEVVLPVQQSGARTVLYSLVERHTGMEQKAGTHWPLLFNMAACATWISVQYGRPVSHEHHPV